MHARRDQRSQQPAQRLILATRFRSRRDCLSRNPGSAHEVQGIATRRRCCGFHSIRAGWTLVSQQIDGIRKSAFLTARDARDQPVASATQTFLTGAAQF
jgi:hypothetical protein